MYLITGATGNVGSTLVRLLHEQGHAVRTLVRDPSRAQRLPDGIDIAIGDLDDLDSLTAAASGVDGIFYMQVNPGTAPAKNIVAAARAAHVPKIVALSSIGVRLEPVDHPIGADLAAREAALQQSGLDVTYLRPNAFMSNALWWLPTIADGRVVDATEPGRYACVDPDDIARVAAVALTEDGHAGHGYILSGPHALTAREQVEIIAEVLGRDIEFVSITPEQLADSAVEHGMPADRADALRQLNELFRSGRAGVVTDDVENLTGTAPGTFRAWCERNADVLRAIPAQPVAASQTEPSAQGSDALPVDQRAAG